MPFDNAGTIYMQHTDKKGHTYPAEHRCWDTKLFIEAAAKAAQSEGGKVEVITERQYQQLRRK